MTRQLLGTLIGGLALAGVTAAQAAQLTGDVAATLIPGGVADTAGKTGFVGAEQGGLDAVNLQTGQTLWHADGKYTPLLAANGRVYVLEPNGPANVLQIVKLDAAHGRRTVQTQTFALPAWVSTAEGVPGLIFRAQARLENGALVLQWGAVKRRIFGNPPAGGVPKPLTASGTVRVAATGTGVTPQTDTVPTSMPPAPPRGPVTLGAHTLTLVELPAAGNAPNPRRLECRDAATGKLLWQHALTPRPPDLSRLVM